MAQANVGLALPAWPQCPFLPRKPNEVPKTAASFCLLANGGLLFYLLWRKTACHCGFAVGPTNCLCFSQLWNATKSNRVGRWLLPGKRATSLSTMVGRGISIYALGPVPVCASRHKLIQTHTSGQQFRLTHTHACTHTLVNPIAVQSWLSALYSKYIQVSHERDTYKLLMVGFLQNAL